MLEVCTGIMRLHHRQRLDCAGHRHVLHLHRKLLGHRFQVFLPGAWNSSAIRVNPLQDQGCCFFDALPLGPHEMELCLVVLKLFPGSFSELCAISIGHSEKNKTTGKFGFSGVLSSSSFPRWTWLFNLASTSQDFLSSCRTASVSARALDAAASAAACAVLAQSTTSFSL